MTIVTRFDLLKHRRTKIIATVGPSSRQPAQVRALIQAGVDVFRVNMSHGKHAEHAAAIAVIREEAAALGTHTAILADLCGPKIRTGKFPDGPVSLVRDTEVTVTIRDVPGSSALIPSQYAGLAADVQTGDRILLNDGAAELVVLTVVDTEVHCRVVQGGPIGDHKGINLPGVKVSAPSLTSKDIEDARFALAQQVDFISEHTFFCAIDPSARPQYVERMEVWLKPGGYLLGNFFVLSERDAGSLPGLSLTSTGEGPPFATTVSELRRLFASGFEEISLRPATTSEPDRRPGMEWIGIFRRL